MTTTPFVPDLNAVIGEHDPAEILREILADYSLRVYGDHGVEHWARVLENGLAIAERTGADREIVMLFALFHDSRRLDEWDDLGHGLRGAVFARTMRGKLVHLDDERFELLYEACRLHADGHLDADPTIQACWDADRLDLARVGIAPELERLCTDAARELMEWANERARRGHVPSAVLAQWDAPAR